LWPLSFRGGIPVKARKAALAALAPSPDGPPLVAAATRSYNGEGFDCPTLDTLLLAGPVAFRGPLVQYVGRILRPYPGKHTAEVRDYHDVLTGVLASSLPKRAPGYISLCFPGPPPTDQLTYSTASLGAPRLPREWTTCRRRRQDAVNSMTTRTGVAQHAVLRRERCSGASQMVVDEVAGDRRSLPCRIILGTLRRVGRRPR